MNSDSDIEIQMVSEYEISGFPLTASNYETFHDILKITLKDKNRWQSGHELWMTHKDRITTPLSTTMVIQVHNYAPVHVNVKISTRSTPISNSRGVRLEKIFKFQNDAFPGYPTLQSLEKSK